MKNNKIYGLKYIIINLGVPARKLAVGLSATTPQAEAVGLMVAAMSFLRSLCRSLCPINFRLCGVFATIPNAKHLSSFSLSKTAIR